MIRSFFSKIN